MVGQPPNDQVPESGKENQKEPTTVTPTRTSYDDVSEPPNSTKSITEPVKQHEYNTSAQTDSTDCAKVPLNDHLTHHENPAYVIDNSVIPFELDVDEADPDTDIATNKQPMSQENGAVIDNSDQQRINANVSSEYPQILRSDVSEHGDPKLECDHKQSATD